MWSYKAHGTWHSFKINGGGLVTGPIKLVMQLISLKDPPKNHNKDFTQNI